MKIRVGYELVYDFTRPTPMIIITRHPFYPGFRRHRARLPDHQPIGTDLALPGRLRQLVQPDRRLRWPNAVVGRWRRS